LALFDNFLDLGEFAGVANGTTQPVGEFCEGRSPQFFAFRHNIFLAPLHIRRLIYHGLEDLGRLQNPDR
jgi:hypothetical protein